MLGATGLIYEPLLQFNLTKPPQYYPWLATSYTWGNGGKSITFAIRRGVKWNDGKPMTPADVVFTYNLVKKFPAVNLAGLSITSVSSSGNNVTVNFSTPEYLDLSRSKPRSASDHPAGRPARRSRPRSRAGTWPGGGLASDPTIAR